MGRGRQLFGQFDRWGMATKLKVMVPLQAALICLEFVGRAVFGRFNFSRRQSTD